MYLKHGVCRAAAFAALMAGTAPVALFAETPADTLVIADAIDDIVSIDPHEAFEFSGLDLTNNLYDTLIELETTAAAARTVSTSASPPAPGSGSRADPQAPSPPPKTDPR